MIFVSACLVGINCKYSGGNNYNQKVFDLVKKGKAIPICPEQLGGLQTPRNPAEIKIIDGKKYVIDNKNDNNIHTRYSMNLDGSHKKIFFQTEALYNTHFMFGYNNELYFHSHKTNYKINLDNSDLTRREVKAEKIKKEEENNE